MNGVHLQVKLIQAQIFEPTPATHFTVSISSKGNQYHTSTFPITNNCLDLQSCSPIAISVQQSTQPFLKVVVGSCNNAISYQTQVDYKVIEAILLRGRGKQRHILAFPLFKSHSVVVGELKVKLALTNTPSKEMRSEKSYRIIEEGSEESFQPLYSRMIKVSLHDEQHQFKQLQLPGQGHREKPKRNVQAFSFEPFREEISEIMLKQSHEGRFNEQEQRQMEYLARQSNPLGQGKQSMRQSEHQEMPDIPEDCQHLFQKINEINRRYAPLEKIPSQEQLSDYSELNQGDYKVGCELEQEQISHPLQEVQQLLKQLDLYKFAQTLP